VTPVRSAARTIPLGAFLITLLLRLSLRAQEPQPSYGPGESRAESPPGSASESEPELAEPSEQEREQLAWQDTDPRREGAAVITLSGELAIQDPQSASAQSREVGGGFHLAVVGRGRKWPLLFGLGIGVTYLDYSSQAGPREGFVFKQDTTLSRSLELRHVDLIVRVQPWWGRVRPYVEGSFGLAGLWDASAWTASDGTTLDSSEKQRSVSYLTGASVGLDVVLWTLSDDELDATHLLLSVGARRLYTGPMTWTWVVLSQGSDEARLSSVRERMRLWQPFVSLSLSFGTKPRPASVP
jgi:hypothetical protein